MVRLLTFVSPQTPRKCDHTGELLCTTKGGAIHIGLGGWGPPTHLGGEVIKMWRAINKVRGWRVLNEIKHGQYSLTDGIG